MKKLPVAVAALLALTACVPGGENSPTPTSTPEVTTASPTPTPITPSATPTTSSPSPASSATDVESFPPPPATESADQAAIRTGWSAYWAAMDKFLKDPRLEDVTELTLTTASGSEEFNAALDQVGQFKQRGWKIEGDRVFRDVVVAVPVANVGSPRTSTVTYCHDVTRLRVVELSSDKPADVKPIPTGVETVTMLETADGRWQVSQIRNKAATC